MAMQYNGGVNPNPSSIGANLSDFYYYKKALIDAVKEQYFSQLASTRAMPAHYGQTIKQFHYIPMLDDNNINDEGIDASGNRVLYEYNIYFANPSGTIARDVIVGTGETNADAQTDARTKAIAYLTDAGITPAAWATMVTSATTAGWTVSEDTSQLKRAGGNLYGSSKDVGYIISKLPHISETGGRVNRVGFTRKTLEGSIEDYGFFDEYTRDSLNFDNDADLLSHITREAVRGANEITEGLIQIDLLNSAGITMYGGAATSKGEIIGEGANPSVLTYDMLVKADIELNNNRCPKDTEIITGSRMIDTKVIGAARYAYIGSALKPALLRLTDYHGKEAFVPVQQYADGGNIARGEIGAIGNLRFIEVPEMFHFEGVGAKATGANAGYKYDMANSRYNVYPILIVGSGSFATIGFQTSGDNVKFEIIHKKPSTDTADKTDPYGKVGFYSIQWWYGFMALRPEWIACLNVVAPE
jgi:N4-gp56 family major capsid protein